MAKFYIPADSTPVAFALTMVVMTLHPLIASGLCLALTMVLHAQEPATPEARAVAFLAKEVAATPPASGCASCHHHGDAARALFMAGARGHDTTDALKSTLAFLNAPAGWTANKTHHGEADFGVARLQFAAALAAAGEKDLNPSPALVEAARLLVVDQRPDGSWAPVEATGPGTPITYGTTVATWLARATLIASGRQPDDFVVAQTDRFLRTVEITNVFDAAGVLLGLGVTSDVMADKQRAASLGTIRRAQQESGGWGPDADSPASVFDTSLVMLALGQLESDPRLARSTYRVEELHDALARSRAYLAAQQRADGSWPETVRPGARPNAALRLSTTGWALVALLGGPK
jgi:Prenyltransferase and squalene oxidase repeat